MKYFPRPSPCSAYSRRAIVNYKPKYCALSAGQPLSLSLLRENEVRLTDHLDMAIAVDWDDSLQTKIYSVVKTDIIFYAPKGTLGGI